MKIINPIYDQAFKYNLKQYLNRATQDEEMIRILELEEDIDQEFEKLETALDLARQGEEEALRQKEEAQRREMEAQQTISNMAKQLYLKGVPTSEIAAVTGKSEEEIKTLLKA